MLSLIVLHFAAACCAPPLVRWLGPRAFLVLAAAPAAVAAWAVAQYGDVAGGAVPTSNRPWIPGLGVHLAFRCDALALLMLLIVGGVGALVMVYCAGYFGPHEPQSGQFAGTLTAFAGAMTGLVVADDVIVLYVLWELTTIFSFLLIGHAPQRRANRLAALQALIVTTLGGLAMLVGLLMLGHAAGGYRLSALLAHPPVEGPSVSVALVLVLAGALSKSAVWPFSLWLPGAMAAPTPVSAYLHAAAMVKAGIYLVARLAPAFDGDAAWQVTTLALGSATMLLGGWRALRELDLKRLLAYGTVSQLGFLTVLAGTGSRDAALSTAALIWAHALFKAALFLVVGIVDHATGTRRLEELGGLARALPGVCTAAVLAGASMAAVPPLLGFAAKEAALQALLLGGSADQWPLAAVVLGSALTTAYTLRFLWGAFRPRRDRQPDPNRQSRSARWAPPARWNRPGRDSAAASAGEERTVPLPRTRAALFLPVAVCALASLVLGPGAPLIDPLLARYADAFPAPSHPLHLSLWHGFGPAFALSALAWAAGGLLFAVMGPLGRLGERLSTVRGESVFARALWALERLALQATGTVQRGSLPVYVGTALAVLIGAQLAAAAVDPPWPDRLHVRWADSAAQLAVAVLVCGVAVLCVTSRQRMRAVVLAGVTGYGTALLYVMHGAPDLALTQFAVETVSLVVFVLVLRRLPARFADGHRTATPRRIAHLVLGLLAGVFTAGLVYVAGAARAARPAGPGLAAATAHEKVKNVVSTTLVDLRSWDTMGESAVLAVAAVGVTSLVYLRRHAGAAERAPQPAGHPAPTPSAPWDTHPPDGEPARPRRPSPGERQEERRGEPAAGEGKGEGKGEGEEGGGRSGAAEPREARGPGAGRPRRGGPSVWPVLGTRGRFASHRSVTAAPRRTWLTASATLAPERRSVIFEVVARLVFHPILVLSLYLLFTAENMPGGGFTAGLVAGLALAVRYLAGGRYELAAAAPVDAGFLLGLGLLILTGTGLAGLWLGGAVLRSGSHHGELPLIGDYHGASTVLFDTGVYLLVLGVVLDVLRSLGSEVDRRLERELRRRHRKAQAEGAGGATAGGGPGTGPADPEGPRRRPGGGEAV